MTKKWWTLQGSTKTSKSSAANIIRKLSSLIRAGISNLEALKICEQDLQEFSEIELKQFNLIWSISNTLGGPVVLSLTRLAEVFDIQARNKSEVQLAFAGPQSTAKLVNWLPVVALLLAQLVGMNPAAAIVGSPLGLLSVCLGAGLLVLGHQWSKRLLAKALPPQLDPGAYIDCVLIGLQAGLPLQAARQQAALGYRSSFDIEPTSQDESALNDAAELSRKSGAALTEILQATANRFRDELRFEIANRIARLGIKLMIPLGVAVLPAFILLSIVPIAISLLSSGQL